GQMNIQLKPLAERNVTADQVIARLRPKLQLPGSTMFLQSPQELRVGGRGGNAQFQYTVQADTIEDLQKWAGIMLDGIKALPQIRDSNTDLANRGLETRLVIDRDTASRLGVTPQIIDNALYSAFGQRQVSTMYKPLNQYHVVMEAELANQPWLILAALFTVYIVLGVLYESYIHPITILSTLPSAGVGALLALLITKSELNVIGMIGIILLIGIVKKNAIMMIDFALEAERNEGKGLWKESIKPACCDSVRS